MEVSTLWVVYLAALIFFLFVFFFATKFSIWICAFFASLLAALVFLFASSAVILRNRSDEEWYNALMAVAFILPIIFLILTVLLSEWFTGCRTKTTFACDETGCVPLEYKKDCGDKSVKVIFTPSRGADV